MKRNYLILLFILICIAIVSGILTTGMSFIGQLGISFFYTKLSFLKSWWQSALICFTLHTVVSILTYLIDRNLKGVTRKILFIIFFTISLIGLYVTFQNFRSNIAYRWMGERFHIGIYLYWIGVSFIILFFALTNKKKVNNKELS